MLPRPPTRHLACMRAGIGLLDVFDLLRSQYNGDDGRDDALPNAAATATAAPYTASGNQFAAVSPSAASATAATPFRSGSGFLSFTTTLWRHSSASITPRLNSDLVMPYSSPDKSALSASSVGSRHASLSNILLSVRGREERRVVRFHSKVDKMASSVRERASGDTITDSSLQLGSDTGMYADPAAAGARPGSCASGSDPPSDSGMASKLSLAMSPRSMADLGIAADSTTNSYVPTAQSAPFPPGPGLQCWVPGTPGSSCGASGDDGLGELPASADISMVGGPDEAQHMGALSPLPRRTSSALLSPRSRSPLGDARPPGSPPYVATSLSRPTSALRHSSSTSSIFFDAVGAPASAVAGANSSGSGLVSGRPLNPSGGAAAWATPAPSSRPGSRVGSPRSPAGSFTRKDTRRVHPMLAPPDMASAASPDASVHVQMESKAAPRSGLRSAQSLPTPEALDASASARPLRSSLSVTPTPSAPALTTPADGIAHFMDIASSAGTTLQGPAAGGALPLPAAEAHSKRSPASLALTHGSPAGSRAATPVLVSRAGTLVINSRAGTPTQGSQRGSPESGSRPTSALAGVTATAIITAASLLGMEEGQAGVLPGTQGQAGPQAVCEALADANEVSSTAAAPTAASMQRSTGVRSKASDVHGAAQDMAGALAISRAPSDAADAAGAGAMDWQEAKAHVDPKLATAAGKVLEKDEGAWYQQLGHWVMSKWRSLWVRAGMHRLGVGAVSLFPASDVCYTPLPVGPASPRQPVAARHAS